MNQLADSIRTSLSDFALFLRESRWRGREREAVSLYAFGHLQQRLDDPRRICIEGAVPAIEGPNKKAQVCKDLVIWPAAAMTTWDKDWNPTNVPVALLEWKLFRNPAKPVVVSADDRTWLLEFTRRYHGVEGYRVTIDLLERRFLLLCERYFGGEEATEWLRL